jgi:hypothetical protein
LCTSHPARVLPFVVPWPKLKLETSLEGRQMAALPHQFLSVTEAAKAKNFYFQRLPAASAALLRHASNLKIK